MTTVFPSGFKAVIHPGLLTFRANATRVQKQQKPNNETQEPQMNHDSKSLGKELESQGLKV
jgi:hypothetical protein